MYYFIVNPHSRHGRGLKIWKKIEQQLRRKGAEYEAFLTERPGQAAEIADDLTRGCRGAMTIVAVGGDGTLGEVLDGLNFCGSLTLGYIPAGRGNDLAKSLGLPASPSGCLKRIFCPKRYRFLDYGLVTYGEETLRHRRFIVSAGIGLDAAVCHSLLYQKPGFLRKHVPLPESGYLTAGLWQLLKAKPSKGYILLDRARKVEFNHIYFISAQIHPSEGGGFCFAPKTDPGDGKMTVCVVSHSSKLGLVPIFLRARLCLFSKKKGVRSYECREALIHTERPMAVHTDGESCQYQSDLEIRCIEKKIKMIV